MNERIRELAEQARVQDRGYFIYQYGGPTGHQSVEKAIDLEKFAQMIVRECVEICKKQEYKYWRSSEEDQWTPIDSANAIQEHFGVGE